MSSAGRFALAALSLWWREQVRFLRQRSRVVGALLTPLLFWLLLGSGLGTSFRGSSPAEGETYLEYFFPGTLVLILLFTAIFSTISVIEDRKEGFLQAVLVAPVSRTSLVLGKVLGGTTLALMQGLLFLALAPLAGFRIGPVQAVAAAAVMALVAFWLTAFGFCIAWKLDSVQGFHVVMNLVLFPIWLMSGALFPPGGAAGWLRTIMRINPLAYGMAGVRRSMTGAFTGGGLAGLPGFGTCLLVTAVLCVTCLIAAVALVGRPEGNLA